MLKKNDLVNLTITDMSDTGDGIGKADGFPLFVRHGVIGDEAEVIVTKAKKTYGYAKINQLIKPSDFRIEPACPSWKRCGGCQLQSLSYEAQLAFKTNKVLQALIRIGGFKTIQVEECIASPDIFRYRNKVQYPVGTDKNGNCISGFYASRSHEIIPCADCLNGPVEFPKILNCILDWMKEFHIQAYREENGTGLVRHVYLRKGFSSGEIGVCLIINGKTVPHAEELKNRLSVFRQITGLTYSANTTRSNVILGNSVEVLYGKRCIRDRIGHVLYQIDPLSFFQVNPQQTRQLYDCVKEFADLSGKEIVWDLYCGIGSISLYLADQASQIIGIEVVERAIEDAKTNALLNHVNNAEFYAGDVADIFPELYEKRSTSGDVIIIDPPRKGCDENVIRCILQTLPQKIVYVSCNPATLARDLRIFAEGDYRIDKVRPFDMFPMSGHVETVALLSRSKR